MKISPSFVVSALFITSRCLGALPASGPVVPELAPFTQAMTSYMDSHGFEAGTLALMKDSKLVFRNGYGFRNTNQTTTIHPDNLFRLASVSKTITGSAIRKLVDAGQLSTSTRVYSYLGIQPWGGTLGDSRITNITVQHLLDHRGGWIDGGSGSEAVFQTVAISTAMALSYPAAASNVISWVWSRPLSFAPGASNYYSNFGYQVLGRVIEKATGKSYIDYLKEDLFGPYGITNIIQSRSRPSDLAPWEIWYAATSTTRSAVDFPTNIQVRYVDGGYYMESFDAFGGLSASAGDLCRYMLQYWVAGARRVPASSYGWNYTFYGSLSGTTTVIYQNTTQNSTSTNGLEFAALFNERTGGNDNEEARNAIINASTNITSWPQHGGGRIEWALTATNVYEHWTNITVRLMRTGAATLPVKVSYTTYGRTAGTNSYAPASGVLAFDPGETSKEIPLTLYDDQRPGSQRDFSLELISASGGAWLGDRVTCIVRIIDPDMVFSRTPTILPAGTFQSLLLGGMGLPLRIEFSTNLVDWQLLQSYTNTPGALTVSDPDAGTRPKAFYRSVTP